MQGSSDKNQREWMEQSPINPLKDGLSLAQRVGRTFNLMLMVSLGLVMAVVIVAFIGMLLGSWNCPGQHLFSDCIWGK